MTRPEELNSEQPLAWTPGTGVQVWRMLCACEAGERDEIGRLLEEEPALARCHWAYVTPLSVAVRENRVEAARTLLARGADPQQGVWEGSLVETAVERGYAEMEHLLTGHAREVMNASAQGEAVAAAIRARDMAGMCRLLDVRPELLEMGDQRSNRPLHWAAMMRQPAMADELLRRGAALNAGRWDGARPIQLCNGDYFFRGWRDVPVEVETTPRQMLDHLIARGAQVDAPMAAWLGDRERLEALLREDPASANRADGYVSYYVGGGCPLFNAAAGGHLDAVRLLLDAGADPNLREEGIAPRGRALHEAAARGHLAIARLLLERGADPNQAVESSGDALSRALECGHAEITQLLAAHGAARPLHILGYYGDVVTAAAMLSAAPDLADDGDALANAVENGQEAFVRLLLRYRPRLPERRAVVAPTAELNELLFKHGMSAAWADWQGVTPLHRIAERGDTAVAEQFLRHGAPLETRDERHRTTPLGWAARRGQSEMVDFLLDRGARPWLEDAPSWAQPEAIARFRGHADVAQRIAQRR